jgi:CheY-like chemotaxis protein
MSRVRGWCSRILGFAKTRDAVDPRLPSLVRALQKLAPGSVVKEVVGSSSDRRQWGVLAAAWLGVSERELMREVAKELKLEFVERVPQVVLDGSGEAAHALLENLRRCAAVPVFDGSAVVGFVTVDPAEVRGIPQYDGKQQISIGCWSAISQVLEVAERELREREEAQAHSEIQKQEELSRKVVDIILQEAAVHGATVVEVVTVDGRSRYQFTTPDGRRGHGNIHKGIVSSVLRFLARVDGATYRSQARGEVVVRSLGSLVNFRIAWSSENVQSLLPAPELQPQSSSNDEAQNAQEPVEPSNSTPLPAPSLPVASVPTPLGAPLQAPQTTQQRESVTRGEPILVVDDNPMFCRVLERLLVKDGYAPLFAENGAIALEKLNNTANFMPKVIVSDLHMPVMNGKEFVAKVKADPRLSTIPVVMLTSDDDVEAELSLLDIGADAFVSKTRDPRVLCAQVKRLMERPSSKVAHLRVAA